MILLGRQTFKDTVLRIQNIMRGGKKKLWIFAGTPFPPISLLHKAIFLLLLYFIISSKSYNSFAEAGKISVFDHGRIIQNSVSVKTRILLTWLLVELFWLCIVISSVRVPVVNSLGKPFKRGCRRFYQSYTSNQA